VINEATVNGQIMRPIPRKEQASVPITLPPCNYSVPRRFLHTRPSDKAESLNTQIDRYAQLAAASLSLQMGDFGHPGMPTPTTVTVVGRVVGESEGKLTEGGILLESSRQMGSGCRVPLVLGTGPCAFFPGQIVVLEGSNPDGSAFHVAKQKTVTPRQMFIF
jgi:DNA polymerase alpha subunit B